MTAFLPDDEQKLYDSMVHGLREQGWSKSEAEGEAIARIAAKRQNSASFTVEDINPVHLEAAFLGMTINVPGDGKDKVLGRGTVTITHMDGTEETMTGTWTKVFNP